MRTAAALSVVNFFWGVGAIACSLTIYSLSKSFGYFPVSLFLTISFFVIAALLAFIPRGIEQKPFAGEDNSEDFSTPIWTNPIAWAIAGFNFIHVGFESAIGGWLPTYTERSNSQNFSDWLAPTFLYFLFFVIGRGIAPVFFRYLNENKMLILNLLTILLGMIVLLFAPNILFLSIGAAIADLELRQFSRLICRVSPRFSARQQAVALRLFLSAELWVQLLRRGLSVSFQIITKMICVLECLFCSEVF
jgi:fucose permease